MGSALESVGVFLLNLLLLRKITQTGVVQNNKAKSMGEPGMLTTLKCVETSNKEEVNNLVLENSNRFEYGNNSV